MQLDLTPKRRLTSLIVTMALSPGVFAAGAAVEDGMPPLDCVILPSVVADLSSSIPGVLSDVRVGRSDLVARGQVVAELESTVETMDAQLTRARNGMGAETHQRHVNSAYGRHGQPTTQDAYRSEAATHLDTEGRRTIQSPIRGVVVERFKATGEYVTDEPVVRVAQLDPLYVETVVPVEHLRRVREGVKAKVWSETLPNTVWHPSVSLVDRVADVASGTIGVRLKLPNPDYSVPAGLRCRVQFLPSTAEPAVVAETEVPASHAVEKAAKAPERAEATVGRPSHQKTGRAPRKTEITRSRPTEVVAVETSAVRPREAEDRTSDLTPDMSTAGDETAASLASTGVTALPIGCQRAGPFEDARRAEDQAQEFRRHGFEVEIEKESRLVQAGLRVMSQQMPSREAVKRYIERLLAAGVRDLYPVTRGRYKNHVALGLYRNPRPARERIEELTAMGFEVELKPWRKRETEYFLTLRGLPTTQDAALSSALPRPESDDGSDSWTCEMLTGLLTP